MIIGDGLLAKAMSSYFENDSSTIIFASGVSNSQEINKECFLREKETLLKSLDDSKKFVYFSTASLNDLNLQESPYVLHKKEMESLVRSSKKYFIFRLPQVVGHTKNPHTLTNYLYNKIVLNESFQIWANAKRNLIDISDVALIAAFFIKEKQCLNSTINIACPFSLYVVEIVKIFEKVLNKKANYSLVELGGSYSLDISLMLQASKKLGISFDDRYVENIIKKYYRK